MSYWQKIFFTKEAINLKNIKTLANFIGLKVKVPRYILYIARSFLHE